MDVNETNLKILGLATSLRRASIHRGLLRAAHEVCPQGMACESFDLGRIPHSEPVRDLTYERFDENGDLTDEQTRQRLRRFIEAFYEWTDGLVRAGLVEKESLR